MCGINGLLRLDPGARLDPLELDRTRDLLARRGPDGCGSWTSPSGCAALGHRRLAILDLSERAAQPMPWPWERERYRLVFNGEIYNFRALRDELRSAGVAFRTESDSEVMLALYERQGPAMLGRLRGMFALAIWDERDRTLLLARDRFGIKPLYYAAARDALRFASQVKALEGLPQVGKEVSPAGLAGFLLWGAVPEPHTIRRAVRCLPAGHYLLLRADAPPAAEPLAWAAPETEPDDADHVETASAVATAVEDSVQAHLVSDVPVGVFLSAGLDSSLITALARRYLDKPPLTLTVAFDLLRGTNLDEAPQAAATARALGTEHVEHWVGREAFAELWDGALSAMDQPSIDGFNSYLVSAAARAAGLKVVLSGLGGDELFGGYRTFDLVPQTMRWAQRLAASPLVGRSWERWARLAPQRKARGLVRHGTTLAGSYYLRRALFLPEELPALLGREAAAEGLAAGDPRAEAGRALAETEVELAAAGVALDPWLAVQGLETRLYLKNQLLRDADWGAMAHSVELRVPFVDAVLHRHLLAHRFEPGRSRGKAALFRQIAPELPEALWRRRKTGFYIPMAEWAAGDRRPGRAGRRGEGSRRLAADVLAGFGIELDAR